MRYRLLPLLAVGLMLLAGMPAAAQVVGPVTVLPPPNPTTSTPVILRFMAFDMCGQVVTWSRNGNAIRIDISQSCVNVLPTQEEVNVNVGTLPAGVYTYEVYTSNFLDESGTFVVAQALPIVPTLSEIALGALCALLAVAGWFAVARR